MNCTCQKDLDQDRQIRDFNALLGHTIKAVIHPSGPREVSLVLITETGCWMALDATGGDYEEKPTIEIDPPYYGYDDVPLDQYLSAADSRNSGLINQAAYELLKAREDQRDAEQKKAKVEALRKQLAELEGGAA